MNRIEKDFSEYYGKIGKAMGMDSLAMSIFSILYISPEEMAMDEIAKKTGYSLASISNIMKFMENTGVAQRVKKPKSRKAYFKVEKNIAIMNIYKMRAMKEIMIKSAKLEVPEIIKKNKKLAKTDAAKDQLKSIENYYEQILDFEELMNKWMKDLEKFSKKKYKLV